MARNRDRKNNKIKLKSGDFVLVILTLLLVVFGVMMVYSSSYYYALSKFGDAYHYLKKDLGFAALGFVGMLTLAMIDYKWYRKLAVPGLVVSIVLLILLFTPLGIERNYATRWLGIGSFTLMPGEIAKIAVIIFVSWYLSRENNIIHSFSRGIFPMLVLCGVFGGLIMLQPNMSTAITVCGIIVGIMFMAGMKWRYLFGLGTIGAAAMAILIFSDEDGYRLKRVTSFLDPFADPLDTGFQVVQSLLALGSGGFFGVGLGKSIQKNLYLPEPQNDFILAIIGEELGYFGILLLMLAYIVLIWRGFHIAINAKDMFGSLLASGITIMIALQVLMNVAVVTSSMPPTGVTLPFVSYGGNALWLFMGSVGILLNISRHSAR